MDRTSRTNPSASAAGHAAGHLPTAPGKQTLTAQLDVQLRAGAPAPATDVHAAAAHGIRGGGGALPHLDRIQQAFGRHDVSHVQAHVGGNAAEGAGAMGAMAYAAGDHVAFASAPDLHTAAHEAAHVVQQRGGVQLRGGVGEVGDRYEQHADAVADRVVRGESAEALLDAHAGPAAAGAPSGAIQRYAFINGKQVKKTDPIVSGPIVDFVTDHAVRDYRSADELKSHAAGATDYLGNLNDDHHTWLRFSPTGLNVLGEMHETDSSLKHVLAAVRSKNFISEAISSEDPPAGSELRTAYEAHDAHRFKELGIDQAPDKKAFGAEPLPPKLGWVMTQLPLYLNLGTAPPPAKNVNALKAGNYDGELMLGMLKMAWALGKDTAADVAQKRATFQAVPAKADQLATLMTSLHAVLDPYITGLPEHGALGDTLAEPANHALFVPINAFAHAITELLVEMAIADPSSRMTAKQKKQFAGNTTDGQKADLFADWRNFKFEDSVKDAASRGVRYAGMGYHHMKHLAAGRLPPGAHAYDMMLEDLDKFSHATDELANIAVEP